MFRSLSRYIRLSGYGPKAGALQLKLNRYHPSVDSLEGAECFSFDILLVDGKAKVGEVGIRLGESNALYYLGHIGYHINPSHRGKSYAYQACSLCIPILKELGVRSLIITTDEDNLPSIRTCEKLGCQYECTVPVPLWCQEEFHISRQKRRYIWRLS